jgi:hypothetical protein
MSENENQCRYHVAHHNRIETLEKAVEQAEGKIGGISEKYIEKTTEFTAEIKVIKEELKNLREFIQNKALRLKYVAITACSIGSVLVVGAVELIKLLTK